MTEITLERAEHLKQSLLDFVLDAEGDLAVALEVYSADRSSRFKKSQFQGQSSIDFILDQFLSAGRIGNQTPLDLFQASFQALQPEDCVLLELWKKSFTGLFKIVQVLDDGFEVMNWLTAKQYKIKYHPIQGQDRMARLKDGEILLTRLAPLSETVWIFSGPSIMMGKLGTPKLAVAIGQFKQQFKEDLYGDAPELLQEAWHSVARYHDEWLNFFGQEEIILSGYQANLKLKEFQEKITQEHLAEAGLPENVSLDDLSEDLNSSDNLAEINKLWEVNSDQPKHSLLQDAQSSAKTMMVMPSKTDLPDRFKHAEQLALITHPQWGQMISTIYAQLQDSLTLSQVDERSQKLVHQALSEPEMNAYLWHRLAQQYPNQLESLIRIALDKPEFEIQRDLDPLLQNSDKSLQPELPETASVPLHLHYLFQEAFSEVRKTEIKSKRKPKKSSGFNAIARD